MTSAVCFNFDQSKILSSGNGLNPPSLKLGVPLTHSQTNPCLYMSAAHVQVS